jgi:hypothetical protein
MSASFVVTRFFQVQHIPPQEAGANLCDLGKHLSFAVFGKQFQFLLVEIKRSIR